MSKKIIKIKSGAIKFLTGTPQIRVEKCTQGLKELMEHFECVLIPTMTTQGNDLIGYRTIGDVGVMPMPKETSSLILPDDGKKIATVH